MILVVGSGFLGSRVLQYWAQHTTEEVVGTYRDADKIPAIPGVQWMHCDVTDEVDVRALAKRCQDQKVTVFYFAACHNIDYVYTHPQEAMRINVDALRFFLSTVQGIDKLLFASTDCVYGENTDRIPAFAEQSPLTPISEYGRQKRLAEELVQTHGFTAVRLPYMFGSSLSSKPHFYDTVQEGFREGKSIRMIDGQIRSALPYTMVAKLLAELSKLPEEELPPVVNVCGDRAYTKYALGCLFAQTCGASEDLVERITEEEGKAFFQDNRAHSTVMDNGLLKKLLHMDSVLWEGEVC